MQQQYFEVLARSRLNKKQIENATTMLDKINTMMKEFHEAIAHIRNDGRLSPEGQRADIATTRQNFNERLKQLTDTELSSLVDRIAELELSLRPQGRNNNPVVEQMQQEEVRRLIAHKDELEIMEQYQEAAVSADSDLIMRSIEESPFPLISDPKIIEAGKRARAEREDPKSAEMLVQLRQWLSTISSAVGSAQAELKIQDDSIEMIAAGGVKA